MKPLMYFAISVVVASACEAQAVRGLADVSIIDRDSGVALDTHYYHGEYWVAGRPGGRYAIEIHNHLGERLLAVTSVDGVNVVSGETAAWDQNGYVFSPGDRYQITGWRKSDAEVAAFTFTDLANSYAARTGRPANVGIIGVAVFRERQPPAVDQPEIGGQTPHRSDAARSDAERAASDASHVASGASRLGESAAMSPPSALAAPQPKAKLGTGHGEREYSYVDHTEFLRLQKQPNQVIRIHYDSLDNLFAMGIVTRPRVGTPAPDPFPGSRDRRYVPDPPG
jgi:hypothetical protein